MSAANPIVPLDPLVRYGGPTRIYRMPLRQLEQTALPLTGQQVHGSGAVNIAPRTGGSGSVDDDELAVLLMAA